MESLSNFSRGLQFARDELSEADLLSEEHEKVIDAVLVSPVMKTEDGRTINVLREVHRKARRLYRKVRRIGKIDWTTAVEWIKEHWLEIIKMILMIAPFLI